MNKRPTPWRQRQQQDAERKSKVPEPEGWHRKYWYLIAGVVAGLAWLMKDGADAVEKTGTLPSKIIAVKNQTLSWYHNDEAWNGWWTTTTEGLVDSGDIVVSPFKVQLSLSTVQGKAHGELSSETICSTAPMLGILMLNGEIRGKTLYAVGYQYVGGKRQDVVTFSAAINKNGLAITPMQDPMGLIGKQINLISAFAEDQKNHDSATCAPEQEKYISEHVRRLRRTPDENGRRLIQE